MQCCLQKDFFKRTSQRKKKGRFHEQPEEKRNELGKKTEFYRMGFSLPAMILIAWMSFYPMIQAFILSLKSGMGVNLKFNGFSNYARILKDPTFKQTVK